MNRGDNGHRTCNIKRKRKILPKSHLKVKDFQGEHRSSRSLFPETGTEEPSVASPEMRSEGVVKRSRCLFLKIAPRFVSKVL